MTMARASWYTVSSSQAGFSLASAYATLSSATVLSFNMYMTLLECAFSERVM